MFYINTVIFMAIARLDIRLDEKIKAKAEKATALLGLKSLTEYVVQLMDEKASQTIAEHELMVVPADTFEQFIDACNTATAPNQALREAAEFTHRGKFN